MARHFTPDSRPMRRMRTVALLGSVAGLLLGYLIGAFVGDNAFGSLVLMVASLLAGVIILDFEPFGRAPRERREPPAGRPARLLGFRKRGS